jgi:solute:Na+ symporter, SSS family
MSSIVILSCIIFYFLLLILIAYITGRNANSASYFVGNKQSLWFVVAFGLIGDSLSGITYISVPGSVKAAQFNYFQMVLGYVIGYWTISYVLLPLYYRMELTSIYTYLKNRIGTVSQRTGAFFFILSRVIGAGARLFLASIVLQRFVFDAFGLPFPATVAIIIALMLLYTYKGGIKTLVWTDMMQSSFLLLGVIFSIIFIASELNLSFTGMLSSIKDSAYSQVFFWDWKAKNYFWKQFLGGAFIAICMTGLDQNMMQKNLSCKTLKEAQKNINAFSIIVVFVNMLFLALGALLYIYASSKNIAIPERGDELFPFLAFNHLGAFAGLVFVIGLTAATFNSADSVLTTLTTSFYIDFLGKETDDAQDHKRLRILIHIGFAVFLFLVVLMFGLFNDQSMIFTVMDIAAITYGPLLGLFAFGILTKRLPADKLVPVISLISAGFCCFLYLSTKSKAGWLNGYAIGQELLIINGLITFIGLWLISKPQVKAG